MKAPLMPKTYPNGIKTSICCFHPAAV